MGQDSATWAPSPGPCPEASTAQGGGAEKTAQQEGEAGSGLAVPAWAPTRSFRTQVGYLKQRGLGGAMVWALDMDDFAGSFCGQGRYPLIQTLRSELGESGAAPGLLSGYEPPACTAGPGPSLGGDCTQR